jgi:phosphatidylinositol glycan class V
VRLADIPLSTSNLLNAAYHGIVVANLSHLLSVLLLYRLAVLLPLCKKSSQTQFAFIAAACHILSPAGLFLSAPYAESLFSLLSILGQLLYAFSYSSSNGPSHTLKHDIYLIASGLCFGISATVRGNGLLGGILFAFDAFVWLALSLERMGIPILDLVVPSRVQKQVKSFQSRRLPATIIGGMFVGIGFMTPQYIAYKEYCGQGSENRQPWCSKLPPSIYSWVQNRYW